MTANRINPVYASVKSVTKNLTSNNYGNFDLGMTRADGMVIGVYCPNSGWNCVPFLNSTKWFAYAFKNQTGTTPTFIGNGVTVNSCVIYYV